MWKMHNNLVNILKIHDLQQEEGETIQQFAARLNGNKKLYDKMQM